MHCRIRTPDVGLPRSRWISSFVPSTTQATNHRKGEAQAGVMRVLSPNDVPLTSRVSQAKVATRQASCDSLWSVLQQVVIAS